jgi:Tol biopolymer transport system component
MTSLPVPLTPQDHLLKKVSFKKIKRIIALNSLLLLLFGLLWSTTASAALENIKLNAPLTLDGNVSFFAISPDSSRVVYIADQDTDEVFELYSVPLGGGTVTKLNAPFTTDGEVFAFLISPDSSRVIYLADQDSDTVNELYSVPLGGGTVTNIKDQLKTNGDI